MTFASVSGSNSAEASASSADTAGVESLRVSSAVTDVWRNNVAGRGMGISEDGSVDGSMADG